MREEQGHRPKVGTSASSVYSNLGTLPHIASTLQSKDINALECRLTFKEPQPFFCYSVLLLKAKEWDKYGFWLSGWQKVVLLGKFAPKSMAEQKHSYTVSEGRVDL